MSTIQATQCDAGTMHELIKILEVSDPDNQLPLTPAKLAKASAKKAKQDTVVAETTAVVVGDSGSIGASSASQLGSNNQSMSAAAATTANVASSTAAVTFQIPANSSAAVDNVTNESPLFGQDGGPAEEDADGNDEPWDVRGAGLGDCAGVSVVTAKATVMLRKLLRTILDGVEARNECLCLKINPRNTSKHRNIVGLVRFFAQLADNENIDDIFQQFK